MTLIHICLVCGKEYKRVEDSRPAGECFSHGFCSVKCEDLDEIRAYTSYAAARGEFAPAIKALAQVRSTLKANWFTLLALAYLVAQLVRWYLVNFRVVNN